MSNVVIEVDLNCRTGDGALIPGSISESADVNATVRGADCTVTEAAVKASGAIGQWLLAAANGDGRLREALQDALKKVCAG